MATPAYLWRWLTPKRWGRALSRLLHPPPKHPFDRAHGVDTDGLIYADPAAQGHAGALHNAGYYATAPSLFRGALELWRTTLPGTGYVLEDYTLVDVGAGKGRVLMLASEYPFRAIEGVELNPKLVHVARKNLCKWMSRKRRVPQVPPLGPGRSAPPIRIIEADALAFPLPDGPVVLFYFNSFEREMTEMWLARLGQLAARRTHPMDLIYVHPEFDALVRQVPGVRTLVSTEVPFSAEDSGADVFGVASDLCAIYRTACCSSAAI